MSRKELFVFVQIFSLKIASFSSSDINRSSLCVRLIKNFCHRSSVSHSIIIVVYMSYFASLSSPLSSLLMLAYSLPLSSEREHAIHIYIYWERSLCANEHISVREEKRKKSRRDYGRERETETEKSFFLLLYVYCFFCQKSK